MADKYDIAQLPSSDGLRKMLAPPCYFEEPPIVDPRTPEFPYRKGLVLTAFEHTAPDPHGRYYHRKPKRKRTSNELLVKQTQLEHCLQNPPTDGKTITDSRRHLKITKQLRAGTACGAQLLVVNDSLVAKVFDPLYYSYIGQFDERLPVDVVDSANGDYTRECAAYNTLDSALSGKEIPKFHGSWTLKLPNKVSGYPATRAVRLILLEYVPGPTMLDLDWSRFTPEQISKLMVRVLEAHVAVRNQGVIHYDFSPRNVIWLSTDNRALNFECNARVVVIDFARSHVRGRDDVAPFPLLKQNPRELYWDSCLDDFYSIMPLRERELQNWLAKHW